MAKQVFDNYDLVRQIYSFGDVEHRKKMSRIRFSNHIHEMENCFHSTCFPLTMSTYALIEYMKKEFCEEDHRFYAKAFLRCRCCSRHSHYKDIPKPEDPVPESRPNFEAYCNCSCRHWYRAFKQNGLA
jgi:hypothetical protein